MAKLNFKTCPFCTIGEQKTGAEVVSLKSVYQLFSAKPGPTTGWATKIPYTCGTEGYFWSEGKHKFYFDTIYCTKRRLDREKEKPKS